MTEETLMSHINANKAHIKILDQKIKELRTENTKFSLAIEVATDTIDSLKVENIKLRAVVDAAKQFMNELDFRGKTHSLDMSNYHGRTIHIKQGESGKPYWLALWSLEQALAELDKEAVKNEKSKP